jgi:chromosome segregation ATPase
LAGATFGLVEAVRDAERKFDEYTPGYRELHVQVRSIQKAVRKLADDIDDLHQQRQRISFSDDVDQSRIDKIQQRIARLETEQKALEDGIPDTWEAARSEFLALAKAEKMARLKYRQNADDSYETVRTVQKMIAQTDALSALQQRVDPLIEQIRQLPADAGEDVLKAYENDLDKLTETHRITSILSRAKRALRGTVLHNLPLNCILTIRRLQLRWACVCSNA